MTFLVSFSTTIWAFVRIWEVSEIGEFVMPWSFSQVQLLRDCERRFDPCICDCCLYLRFCSWRQSDFSCHFDAHCDRDRRVSGLWSVRESEARRSVEESVRVRQVGDLLLWVLGSECECDHVRGTGMA